MIQYYSVNNKEFKFYNLASLSVKPEDLAVVFSTTGEDRLCVRGNTEYLDKNEVVVVDRFTLDDTATMVRDRLVVPDGLLNTVNNRRVYTGKSRACIRKICSERGAEHRTVPGGIQPLTYAGQVAVPDFNMSGTSWYIMPAKILKELVDDYEE